MKNNNQNISFPFHLIQYFLLLTLLYFYLSRILNLVFFTLLESRFLFFFHHWDVMSWFNSNHFQMTLKAPLTLTRGTNCLDSLANDSHPPAGCFTHIFPGRAARTDSPCDLLPRVKTEKSYSTTSRWTRCHDIEGHKLSRSLRRHTVEPQPERSLKVWFIVKPHTNVETLSSSHLH